MNRSALTCAPLPARSVDTWRESLLERESVVSNGQPFTWQRGDTSATSSSYLFEVVMHAAQEAQSNLHRATTASGKSSYRFAVQAAKTYRWLLLDVLPKWTFRPADCHALPDTAEADIYGHYCLARALAYDAVGQADLGASAAARLAAASNAAHLYTVAVQLIEGDSAALVDRAQRKVADALYLHGQQHLHEWDSGKRDDGAASALACYQEAHTRYKDAGHAGCEEEVAYAHDRNQVHWLKPCMPPFAALVRPRVTALPF